ncbi:MAG: Ig-like domain-containing protein [Anaerolineae bacterium]|nr:Ig-like domain-containing protein [Anaerolineae bacterium]
MKRRRIFSLRDSGPWAGPPLVGLWLSLVLLASPAVQASAGRAHAPNPLPGLRAPAGTIVDADIDTSTVWTLEGSPYRVVFDSDGTQVAEGATLTVEPGVEVQFDPNASLIVMGTLKAIGTEARPILFTGTVKEPGSWLFLIIQSPSMVRDQGSVLRHVTIEYAQWNLMVQTATVHLSDCILRHASEVGLWASLSSLVVEGCHIVDNGVYAVENSYGSLILAANNWWGDASGPYHPECNPAGAGDAIADSSPPGVVFRPFLSAPGEEPAPVAAGDALRLSLAPQRWFAPADGVSLIPVKITLRDGAGRPLPGRSVRLQSDLGSVSGAGITNLDGETLAYLSSDTAGDAVLTALVEGGDGCECVAGPEASVTFVEAAGDPLLPGAEAPYMDGNIELEPKPIIQGVPSTVRARLTNPNPYPMKVNATFSYARYGIGVTFAPLGGVEDVRLEANSDEEISVPWLPPASGHVCLRVNYVAHPAGRTAPELQLAGGGQTNFSIEPGALGSPGTGEGDEDPDEEPPDDGDPESEKDCLKKAKAAMDRINDGQMALDAITSPENLTGMAIPNALFSYLMDFNLESWSTATQALGQCPPRQDYDTYATLESYTFTPLVPGGDLSAARAAAGNALMEAMLDLTPRLRAAALSLDRYSGAANANDLYWASEQAATLIYYKQQSGATMLDVAGRMDDLLAVMLSEGVEDLTVPVAEVVEYQARLASEGFNADEIAAARSIGLGDAEIEAIRQARIAADPAELAGSVVSRLSAVADALRSLGPVLQNPPNFEEDAGRAADASLAATNLARIFVSQTPFQIGNPLAETATVELRVRRLDLPPDWMVTVSPAAVELGPGEEVTGLLGIRPGLAAVQGTQPRVAVEGYVDGELIGGVVTEVMVPRHVLGGPKQKVYLPLVIKGYTRGH